MTTKTTLVYLLLQLVALSRSLALANPGVEFHEEEEKRWSELPITYDADVNELLANQLQEELRAGMLFLDDNGSSSNNNNNKLYKVNMERRAMQWGCTEDWESCAVNPWKYKDPIQWVTKLVVYMSSGIDNEITELCYADLVDVDGTPIHLIPEVADEMNSSLKRKSISRYFESWAARGAHVFVYFPTGLRSGRFDTKLNLVFSEEETWKFKRIFSDSAIFRQF